MSKNLLKLEEAANLSGIGHFNVAHTSPTSSSTAAARPRMTRTVKRQRVSVLEEELSKLTTASTNDDDDDDDNDNDNDNDAGEHTLENIYELAKMSTSLDNQFFRDFHEIHGIPRLLSFLSSNNNNNSSNNNEKKKKNDNNEKKKTKRKHYLRSPSCVSIAAKLTSLCIMRGPTAKPTSDDFVKNNGMELFLEANSYFLLNDDNNDDNDDDMKDDADADADDDSVDRFEASSDIWYTLGMICSKSGKKMDHELQMSVIDSILSSMDKLGERTARTTTTIPAKEGNNPRSNNDTTTTTHALKALHGVYRTLNYLIDHVEYMTRQEIEDKQLFSRCHAVARTKAHTVTTWESMTRSSTTVLPATYKTGDVTIFLNTKIFFVSCFRKGFLATTHDFVEGGAIQLCVETIKRNSCLASRNIRAQNRRHCVFDVLLAACHTVHLQPQHRTLWEQSGILGAIEMTLSADYGTVKSTSKIKARELLKELVTVLY